VIVRRIGLVLCVVVLVLVAGGAPEAQEIGLSPAEAAVLAEARTDAPVGMAVPDWGTDDSTWVTIPASSCSESENNTFVGAFGWYYGTSAGTRWFDCAVPLHTGTLLSSIGLEYDDTDASSNVSLTLRDCEPYTTTCSDISSHASTGTPGKDFLGWYTVNLTIDNLNRFYMIRVVLGSGTPTTKFRNIYLATKLQVSPAPASATFNDVPTGHLFFRYVEALADSGITAGCGNDNFCPDSPVTRGQMAVFLSKALGLHWQY
jgi:hypothetical protein